MAGQYDVSTDTMAQAQVRMDGSVADIRSELAAMRGKLAALEGQWAGDARTAFTAAEARYERANTMLNQALDELSSAVRTAGGNYTAQDQDAHTSIQAAGAGMDVRLAGF